MFDMSLEKLFVLGLIALFVVGPDRLPATASWAGQTIRRVKQFTTAASEQIRRQVGPEFDQLRQPLAELSEPLHQLRQLRAGADPRRAVTYYLRNPHP
jgi:sec-independent protein translocase protein TatB